MIKYDTIILGAGISGISCAIYLKRAGINVLIIENGIPGGQLNKASVIENYPGYVSIGGSELSAMLLEQVQTYNIDLVYDEVSNIDYDKNIVTVGDVKYCFEYLVFATGRREKLLGLDNEDKLLGRGISLCATCDGTLYKDCDVLVVGGGSSAVSEAIYLSNICRKVYLSYRGSELGAEEILKNRIKEISNIEIIYNSNVISYLIDNNNKLYGACLDNSNELSVSCVFLAIGHIPNSELFIGDKKNGYIIVDENGMSSINGVYACGDIIDKRVYQLITASSEGILVASSIIRNNEVK